MAKTIQLVNAAGDRRAVSTPAEQVNWEYRGYREMTQAELAEEAQKAQEQASAPQTEGGGQTGDGEPAPYDPGEHSVADVQAYLSAHPEETEAVLAAESAGKNRTSLVG